MIFNISSGVNDSIFGYSQYAIKAHLEQIEESFEQMSMLKHIFNMEKVKEGIVRYTSETSLQDFEPVGPENGAYPQSSMQEGYYKDISVTTWKNQFRITQEAMEDGKMGKAIRKDGRKFMLAYHRTREKFGAELLRRSTTTTLTVGKMTFDISGADGQPLFSTIHPSITGNTGVQSNLYDGVFSYDNLSRAEEKIQKFTDEDGNLLNIQPDTIIIPNNVNIVKSVKEVLNSDGIPGSANNDGNYQFGRWNVIVWNYLGNPAGVSTGHDWWILQDSQLNKAIDGLVWNDRIPLTTKSYIDEGDDANVFSGRARFSAAPVNWRPFLACVPGGGGTPLI